MARDYKHRVRSRYNVRQKQSVSWWKWLLAAVLILFFGGFLYFLKSGAPTPPDTDEQRRKTLPLPKPGTLKPVARPAKEKDKAAVAAKETGKNAEQESPKFDFYTILPEKEVVVPDHEIKTRTREERVGKAKNTQYIIQAGSFRNYKDADRMKAQLALMGIESKIEKATVGNAIWNRIKIGPFTKMSSVDDVRSRLRQNKIDVVVMEKH